MCLGTLLYNMKQCWGGVIIAENVIFLARRAPC